MTVPVGHPHDAQSKRVSDGAALLHCCMPSVGCVERQRRSLDRLHASCHVAQRIFLYFGTISRGKAFFIRVSFSADIQGWIFAGMAVRMVLSTGLHQIRSCVFSPEPPRNPWLRNKTYLLAPTEDATELAERISTLSVASTDPLYMADMVAGASCPSSDVAHWRRVSPLA